MMALAKVPFRGLLIGWAAPEWLCAIVDRAYADGVTDDDCVDVLAAVYNRWFPPIDARADIARLFRRADGEIVITPPDRVSALLRECYPETASAVFDRYARLFEMYFVEYVELRTWDTVPEHRAHLAALLRERLACAERLAALLPEGTYPALEYETMKKRARQFDELFARDVVPRLQSSVAVAHDERLLAVSGVEPGAWWGLFALDAGEVYASDPRDIEADFADAVIAETDLGATPWFRTEPRLN